MTRRVVQFQVFGEPQTKGSTKTLVVPVRDPRMANAQTRDGRPGRVITTNDNPKAKNWQHLVAVQAQQVAGDGMFLGPVAVGIVFHLRRPKSLPKRRVHHTTRPDVDKAARSLLDGLSGVLYQDDAQVVRLVASKVYAAIGAVPGAVVTVAEAAPPDLTQPKIDDLFSEEVLCGTT